MAILLKETIYYSNLSIFKLLPMKKLSIILIYILYFSIGANAKGVRPIKNYTHTTSIEIKNLEALITVDGIEKKYTLENKNGVLSIQNSESATQFLQLDATQNTSLRAQYDTLANGKYKTLSLINQIINRANEIDGIVFKNAEPTNTNNNLQVVDDAENDVNPELVEPTNINTETDFTEAKRTKNILENIWPWLLALITCLGLGFVLGKRANTNTNTIEIEEEPKPLASSNKETKTTKKNVTVAELREINKANATALKQLTKENTALQAAQNALMQNNLKLQQEQKIIFDAVEQQVIAPYLKAVEQNNTSAIAANALKGIAYLTSITRAQKNFRQEYDIQNMELLKGTTLKNSKEINAQTHADDIPKDIKAIISVMQKNNISEIPDVSFFGYTIKKA
jgi:hypothetical protein